MCHATTSYYQNCTLYGFPKKQTMFIRPPLIHTMLPSNTHYAPLLYTLCPLLYTLCPPLIHTMLPSYTRYAPLLYTLCPPLIHTMPSSYTHCALLLYTLCSAHTYFEGCDSFSKSNDLATGLMTHHHGCLHYKVSNIALHPVVDVRATYSN